MGLSRFLADVLVQWLERDKIANLGDLRQTVLEALDILEKDGSSPEETSQAVENVQNAIRHCLDKIKENKKHDEGMERMKDAFLFFQNNIQDNVVQGVKSILFAVNTELKKLDIFIKELERLKKIMTSQKQELNLNLPGYIEISINKVCIDIEHLRRHGALPDLLDKDLTVPIERLKEISKDSDRLDAKRDFLEQLKIIQEIVKKFTSAS